MVTLSPQGPTVGAAGTLHLPELHVKAAPKAPVPSLPSGVLVSGSPPSAPCDNPA